MPVAGSLPPRYGDAELIARGAMGDVYLARDRELGRDVAIKLLGDAFLADADVRRRFTREGRAAACLSGHPHIVTIYDVGEWGGRPYIVMEHLPGGTVAERARGCVVARGAALDWLRQAADALDAAHRRGIVHRDVKPANMVFDAHGRLHVADFGIARVLDETAAEATVAGTVLGTAGYLAPEQASGHAATPASDLYALAVVAYELLTGGRPFKRDSQAAEAAAHVTEPPPPPSQRGVGLGAVVDCVFAYGLAKDPSRRQASCRQLVEQLAVALDLDTPAQRPASSTRAAGRRRRPPAALALAVFVVLAGGAGAAGAMLAAHGGDGSAGRTLVSTRGITSHAATTGPLGGVQPPAGTRAGGGHGHALNDRGYALMQRGSYADALPLLRSAVIDLRGTGPHDPYEGYANYNLGSTLLALDRCGAALPPLRRAGRLEQSGEVRSAIARARRCSRPRRAEAEGPS